MKTYTLKGKRGIRDISFTIADLVPLEKSKTYRYEHLVSLINNRDFDTDWEQPMGEEYKELYQIKKNAKVDFFQVKGTKIIVMPGTYIYPTLLTKEDVSAHIF